MATPSEMGTAKASASKEEAIVPKMKGQSAVDVAHGIPDSRQHEAETELRQGRGRALHHGESHCCQGGDDQRSHERRQSSEQKICPIRFASEARQNPRTSADQWGDIMTN